MFGAAAAMALAQKLDAKLAFEVGALENGAWNYELGRFAIPATEQSKRTSKRSAWSRLVNNKRPTAPPDWHGTVWKEKSFHFDESFEAIDASAYLMGYFQSPKYFDRSADLVRRSFDLHAHLSETGKSYASVVGGDDTVAVHIRRGDYVSNPKATAVHGLLGTDYYARALGLIARTIPSPRVFVVSDEPETARQVISGWPGAEFVTGTTMFDDMHLISACRHHVIANSSFSWWGAWLDPRPDGITVAPRAWFSRDKLLTTYVGDLFPPGWFLT